jgi:hypothetical protein
VKPTAPYAAQQAAKDFTSLVLHEKIHRIEGRHAGDTDIEQVEAVSHELRGCAAILLENDLKVGHASTLTLYDALAKIVRQESAHKKKKSFGGK